MADPLPHGDDWQSWVIIGLVSTLGVVVGALVKRGGLLAPKKENGAMSALKSLADTLTAHQKILSDLLMKAVVSEQYQLSAKEARQEAIRTVREELSALRKVVEDMRQDVRALRRD